MSVEKALKHFGGRWRGNWQRVYRTLIPGRPAVEAGVSNGRLCLHAKVTTEQGTFTRQFEDWLPALHWAETTIQKSK